MSLKDVFTEIENYFSPRIIGVATSICQSQSERNWKS